MTPFLPSSEVIFALGWTKFAFFNISTNIAGSKHMASCMVLSAFPVTAIVVMETLLCLTPMPLALEGRAVAAMHSLNVWERWRNFDSDGRRSLNSYMRALQLTEEHFGVFSMPSNIIST